MDRLWNNTQPHWIVTPTFWCASNLFTFLFMLLLALGYFFYYETVKLEEFQIRYDDICEQSRINGEDCIL
jgi:hypothetical protein